MNNQTRPVFNLEDKDYFHKEHLTNIMKAKITNDYHDLNCNDSNQRKTIWFEDQLNGQNPAK